MKVNVDIVTNMTLVSQTKTCLSIINVFYAKRTKKLRLIYESELKFTQIVHDNFKNLVVFELIMVASSV
jgi:hypothetical protein